MNIAGMVVGILSCVFAFLWFIGLPLGAVGLPLSITALLQKQRAGEGRGMAIAGIATSSVGLVVSIILMALVLS